jgi:hypothetical protein
VRLLVAECSQVIDRFNFDTQSFNADISECKQRNSSSVATRIDTAQPAEPVDDAVIRECRKARGYAVQMETKWPRSETHLTVMIEGEGLIFCGRFNEPVACYSLLAGWCVIIRFC